MLSEKRSMIKNQCNLAKEIMENGCWVTHHRRFSIISQNYFEYLSRKLCASACRSYANLMGVGTFNQESVTKEAAFPILSDF